ncbi:adenosylmethionine-8-amino-7-oxononanoateaminotr ansferase [Leptonema illini DSM 21528]|uniref:Adenosylmethionine-8-amino-7-oxononanoate aminotransferase n=2 Tax=Leptonema illini TaxID=183 RepID=H2CC25_9LEPT|nr:adenosylmethionine-8-amino-7-oxononanoateaminotr ansferase [Leptonema illini DSM 21528]
MPLLLRHGRCCRNSPFEKNGIMSLPFDDSRIKELRTIHSRHSWLPFTQMKLAPEPLLVEEASGIWLTLSGGRRVIDGVGSWWVNTYGHCNATINRALADQASTLEHVIYANFVHEPGLRLAQALSERTSHHLPRVYYSDNGSTAMEIALKMAYQFFRNRGEVRDRIVCLANGYHGDTFGAMAAGARSIFHTVFEPLLFSVDHLAAPSCSQQGLDDEGVGLAEMQQALLSLENHFEQFGDRICCLVLEPLIQGAGGMNFYSPAYLKKARELCDRYGAILIADEVFTGAGRTGPYFAFERAGVWPDIAALSKGLSGGYLPFAATLASERIYEGFLSDDRMHTLYHGHSMTGSPLGCVAALASLSLYDNLQIGDRLQKTEALHRRGLASLMQSAGELLGRPRCMGSVAAFDITADLPYGVPVSMKISEAALDEGLFIRPLGGTVYLCPAFIATDAEIAEMYDALGRLVKRLPQILRMST